MPRSGSRLAGCLGLLGGLTVAGCMQGSAPEMAEAAEQAPGTIAVTGVLTDEGVECPAMRGDDGELYTLTGDLGDLKAGDRVRVQGTVAEMSFCMQGTTLGVRSIERL